MSRSERTTQCIQRNLDLIAAGTDHRLVRDELLARASRRIERLVKAALRTRPDLARWVQDDDLLQDVLVRLDRAVRDAKPANPGQFFTIVAQHVEWATIDLVRRHFGSLGAARRHHTGGVAGGGVHPAVTHQPDQAPIDVFRVHAVVDSLSEQDRDIWRLSVYLEMTQKQIADLLGISTKTVQRRMKAIPLHLAAQLDGDWKDEN